MEADRFIHEGFSLGRKGQSIRPEHQVVDGLHEHGGSQLPQATPGNNSDKDTMSKGLEFLSQVKESNFIEENENSKDNTKMAKAAWVQKVGLDVERQAKEPTSGTTIEKSKSYIKEEKASSREEELVDRARIEKGNNRAI
ncbi:hypothetical protein U1Q18_024017 [Sarracenia purpurea var. burkii]